MKQTSMITEIKLSDNRWHVSCIHDSMKEEDIYMRLCNALIAKKLNECRYIKSIKRRNNYDGTQEITVTYDNAVRNIYTIPTH